ncbi:hypothetical protein OG978_39470 [Streptomyces sp. NBC_01591]|uniref:hypothetical protein n=1 Tax=Streptomyces sp. NBC_01591 TaxID=2975888 RepID=UPI002DD97D60|nr:hypothetical protein [Streptomyces sp. NBC_01591]WSD72922.1 hypothetical protein OG978_39470 [Streptomyces sp. NBC_01591]
MAGDGEVGFDGVASCPSEDRAERLRDLAFGQNPGSALVQQRLKEVVGAAVDHVHRDR